MKYIIIIFVIFIFGCNPIPKKDAHPYVPFLTELLKDGSKFRKVTDMKDVGELIILDDYRILVKPDNSNLPFKIIEINNNIIFKDVYDWKLPFYVDKQGNLYFNRKKFFYPDYKKQEDFKTVVFADSLSKKSDDLKDLNDSLRLKLHYKYEVDLLKPYGLQPCEYTMAHTTNCNVFTVRNGALIVRQTELFKTELFKPEFEISKFDDDVLIGWKNGKLPSPDYLAYYVLGKHKFKCDDMTYPRTVEIAGKQYLHIASQGLYQIL